MTEDFPYCKASQGLRNMLEVDNKKGLPSVVISGEASNPKKGSPFLGSMPNSAITTELVCYNSPLITFI